MEIIEVTVEIKNVKGHLEFCIDNEFQGSCDINEFRETWENVTNEYFEKSFKKGLLFIPKML